MCTLVYHLPYDIWQGLWLKAWVGRSTGMGMHGFRYGFPHHAPVHTWVQVWVPTPHTHTRTHTCTWVLLWVQHRIHYRVQHAQWIKYSRPIRQACSSQLSTKPTWHSCEIQWPCSLCIRETWERLDITYLRILQANANNCWQGWSPGPWIQVLQRAMQWVGAALPWHKGCWIDW